jgi:hypothetical protein
LREPFSDWTDAAPAAQQEPDRSGGTGRKGGMGEMNARPARAENFFALPREARQSKFAVRIFVKKSSDFVQKVPPVGKRGCWLAPCESVRKNTQANFRRKDVITNQSDNDLLE